MKKVRATAESANSKIRIKELGRIATIGEEFTVSDERASILAGANRFGKKFVTIVKSVEPDVTIPAFETE